MGNNSSKKPILVTGASGFIASHTIKLLLQNDCKVRGTVESLSNTQKYNFLKHFTNAENLEIVEADLSNEQCWDKVVEGCEQVLHIAAPTCQKSPNDEDQIIIPAVNATKYVLNAAIKHKVKRLVFTSSCLTILFGNEHNPKLNQTMWSDITKISHYPKAKVMAEKALWQIYKSQNFNQQYTQVVSLLVSTVFGPGFTIHGNSSEALITQIMNGTYPGIPQPQFTPAAVDVRDVAMAHIKALQVTELKGQRIVISSKSLPISQICQTIKQNFPKSKVKMQKITAEQIKTNGNPIAMKAIPMMGKKYEVDNWKGVKLLQMEYTDLKKSIVDMGNQLIKLGKVKLEN